jgi:hypothetical protein
MGLGSLPPANLGAIAPGDGKPSARTQDLTQAFNIAQQIQKDPAAINKQWPAGAMRLVEVATHLGGGTREGGVQLLKETLALSQRLDQPRRAGDPKPSASAEQLKVLQQGINVADFEKATADAKKAPAKGWWNW